MLLLNNSQIGASLVDGPSTLPPPAMSLASSTAQEYENEQLQTSTQMSELGHLSNEAQNASTSSAKMVNKSVPASGKQLEKPTRKRKKIRKKVDPDKRKRIAVACESCKRRKQKV